MRHGRVIGSLRAWMGWKGGHTSGWGVVWFLNMVSGETCWRKVSLAKGTATVRSLKCARCVTARKGVIKLENPKRYDHMLLKYSSLIFMHFTVISKV